MANINYTAKREKFKHLNAHDRGKIEYGIKSGDSMRKIAKAIGFNVSTISREIKKGTVEQKTTELKEFSKYFSDRGQAVYDQNRKNCGCKSKIIKVSDFVEKVETIMKSNKWSPDAAIGRLKLDGDYDKANSICTKTMYNYIDANLLKTRNIDLLMKVRLKLKTQKTRKNKRNLGKSIEERPKEIDFRQTLGNFEIDCVIGLKTKSSALLTLTERKTLYETIVKIRLHDCESVGVAVEKIKLRFGKDYKNVFNSVTSDNGSEFAELTNQFQNVDVYYAHPYSSYERGSNENQNRIIRRFIPKGKNIDDLSEHDIEIVENFLNNLPRRKFGYKTSAELFEQELIKLKSA